MNTEGNKNVFRKILDQIIDLINSLPVKYPKFIVYTAVCLVVFAMFGLFRLKINTGVDSLIPPNSPEVILDKEIRSKYKCGDKFIIVLETTNPKGVFNDGTLLILTILSQELKLIKEISPGDVVSLTTIHYHQQYADLGEFPKAIVYTPYKDSIYVLKKQLFDIRSPRGLLVSLDSEYSSDYHNWKPTAFAIIVDTYNSKDNEAVYSKIKTAIGKVNSTEDRLFVMGAPVAEAELGVYILKDLGGLIPFSILVMILIFYLYYRNWRVVLLPLTEIAGCLIFVFGMIGYSGVPIYLPLTIMPIILISLGLPDVIHIVNTYTHLHEKEPDLDYASLVKQTMRKLYKRLVFTSIATTTGFSSFILSDINSVRYFGLFTSLGLFFCLIWTLFVIPAQILHSRPVIKRRTNLRNFFSGPIVNFSLLGVKHKYKVIAGFLLVTVLAVYYVSKVYVQDSWESCFAEKSSFGMNNNKTNKLFNGTHLLLINFKTDSLNKETFNRLTTDRNGYLLFPEVLNIESKFESFIQTVLPEGEGRISGITGQMEAMNFLLNNKNESFRSTGSTYEENERILKYYRLVMDDKIYKETIDSSKQNTLIQCFIKRPDYKSVPELLNKIKEYEKEELNPKGIRLEFGGDVMQSQTMIHEIVETQTSSLQLSIYTILILLIICFRSIRNGLIGVLSSIFAILLMFALMGYLSIPLGVATSMFASILTGMGVDFSIHMIECYKDLLKRYGNKEIAIRETLAETGPAFFLDAVVLSCSFGLMLFSQVPSNTRLGLAIVSGYLACFVITMILLPALLSINRNKVRSISK